MGTNHWKLNYGYDLQIAATSTVTTGLQHGKMNQLAQYNHKGSYKVNVITKTFSQIFHRAVCICIKYTI